MGDGTVVLPGLDGSTPLGFLAGLGALKVVLARSMLASGDPPSVRLAWTSGEHWQPVLHGGALDLDSVVRMVAEDAEAWASAPVLRFRYPKVEKQGPKLVGALQAPVAVIRGWLRERLDQGDTDSLQYAASLATESASEARKQPVDAGMLAEFGIPFDPGAPLDRVTLPTAFDFTSRNAQFLEQVDAVRASLDQEGIRAVLRDGAADGAPARTLDWDPAADAPGAIYSVHAVTSRPASEWLAFRGLAFFPVAGQGESLHTTACQGRRKSGTFVWPVWEPPAHADTIASLLRCPGIERLSPAARRERGIVQVFRAQLTKKADGYSGMFAPSEPV